MTFGPESLLDDGLEYKVRGTGHCIISGVKKGWLGGEHCWSMNGRHIEVWLDFHPL
jgi:hypothetical protein